MGDVPLPPLFVEEKENQEPEGDKVAQEHQSRATTEGWGPCRKVARVGPGLAAGREKKRDTYGLLASFGIM